MIVQRQKINMWLWWWWLRAIFLIHTFLNRKFHVWQKFLHMSNTFYTQVKGLKKDFHCHNPGSNGGPLELQSTALPAELLRLYNLVHPVILCCLLSTCLITRYLIHLSNCRSFTVVYLYNLAWYLVYLFHFFHTIWITSVLVRNFVKLYVWSK